jgi:hypothetical protein
MEGVCIGAKGCWFFGVTGKKLLSSFRDAPEVCCGVGGEAVIMSRSELIVFMATECGCVKTRIWMELNVAGEI